MPPVACVFLGRYLARSLVSAAARTASERRRTKSATVLNATPLLPRRVLRAEIKTFLPVLGRGSRGPRFGRAVRQIGEEAIRLAPPSTSKTPAPRRAPSGRGYTSWIIKPHPEAALVHLWEQLTRSLSPGGRERRSQRAPPPPSSIPPRSSRSKSCASRGSRPNKRAGGVIVASKVVDTETPPTPFGTASSSERRTRLARSCCTPPALSMRSRNTSLPRACAWTRGEGEGPRGGVAARVAHRRAFTPGGGEDEAARRPSPRTRGRDARLEVHDEAGEAVDESTRGSR